MANPYDHVAVNVALYGDDGYRWTMTERRERALSRTADRLTIGPSKLSWQADGSLVVDLDEIAVPIPRRIRGRLRISPEVRGQVAFSIHASGRHVWQPVAPRARIEVEWFGPRRSWTGAAYVDHNRGTEPLEAAFRGWSWSRSQELGRTRIFYDTQPREGEPCALHLEYGADGHPREVDAPPLTPYGHSLWRLPVAARSEAGTAPRLLERWEDGPFYARSLIGHQLEGQAVHSVHETLSLERFERPVVQAMLPFRMPRRG